MCKAWPRVKLAVGSCLKEIQRGGWRRAGETGTGGGGRGGGAGSAGETTCAVLATAWDTGQVGREPSHASGPTSSRCIWSPHDTSGRPRPREAQGLLGVTQRVGAEAGARHAAQCLRLRVPVLHPRVLPSPPTPMLSPPASPSCFLQGHKGIVGPLGPPGPKGEKVSVRLWEAAAPRYPGQREKIPRGTVAGTSQGVHSRLSPAHTTGGQEAAAIRPTDISDIIRYHLCPAPEQNRHTSRSRGASSSAGEMGISHVLTKTMRFHHLHERGNWSTAGE